MAAATSVSRVRTAWSRILSHSQHPNTPIKKTPSHLLRTFTSIPSPRPHLPPSLPSLRPFSTGAALNGERVVHELLAEVEREKQREREEKRKAGSQPEKEEEEEEEDYMGVGHRLEKLEKRQAKDSGNLDQFWEPTDSDSDEDDERFSQDEVNKRWEVFEKKCKRHSELLRNFAEAGM